MENSRLDQMREDQITQLYELFLAAKENHKEDEDDKIPWLKSTDDEVP